MTSTLLKRLAITWCAGSIASSHLHAQLFEKKEDPFSRKDQTQTQYQQPLQNVRVSVMDGPVDPKEYIVGPGDVYSVNVWISPPLSLQVPVTPEGSIIVPTVGEVSVAGLHLDEAKKKIAAEIRKKYISGDISFTLLTPRIFAVGVAGFGFIEGTVYVQATERADNAIALAEEQTREELKNGPRTNVPASFTMERKEDIPGSRRKVIIQHKDGTRSAADIEKFMATKEARYNPLLRDGDVVVVPAKNIMRDFVGVYGAVNGEGTYEYVAGDSLLSVIRIARGCSPLADSGRVEVMRMDEFGNSMFTIHADMRSIVAGKTLDVSLQRGDRVVVKERVELRRDYKVRIDGEVLYPGFYPVTKDSTKLSEVIAAAGGFTDFASLGTSKIFRRSVTEKEISSERLESARGGVTPEDSAYFYLETNVRLNREQVVADFVSLFSGDKSKDVYVRDGDDIVVASKNKTIYVFGQVIAPGHVPFLPGQNFKFYVQKAGGFTQYAREGDVRIIKANTKQWLDPSETTIEGGDYVWVPKEPYRPFGYYIQVYSQVFGILGTVATLAVLVIQVGK